MLHLYVGRENLPKDKQFIFDVDVKFLKVNVTGTEFQRRVLTDIEKGKYFDSKRFIDRFGGQLYYTDMSTGSKALFEAEALSDVVLNFDECGENAIRLLSLLPEAHIFFSERNMALQWEIDCSVTYNGQFFSKISLLNDWEW